MSGELGQARQQLEKSRSLLAKLDVDYELGLTLWQLAILCHEMGKEAAGTNIRLKKARYLNKAIGYFNDLGVKFDKAQAKRLAYSTAS
jgi:hypothetical protein